MADTRYVRFRYGPTTVQMVAMYYYPGLPTDKFTMILKALLPVQVNVIGLQQGEQGEVVPVTLCCRSPEILRDSTYIR